MVKRRLILNLRGFQVFEAVARHLSVTQAAVELGITQSAVSHQLRHLAEYLGEELIERKARRISLTEAGARLAETIDVGHDRIATAAGATVCLHPPTVRLAMYPSFSAGWLIAALPGFAAAHQDIDLRLVMMSDPPEISDRLADVFITSETPRRGYWSVRLFDEVLLPVAQTGFANGYRDGLPLITSETDPVATGVDWESFAALNGLSLQVLRRGPWQCCSHYLLALEMARAGMGAALIPDFLAAPALARGELFRLAGKPMPTGLSYDLHLKYERRKETDIRQLVTWLRRTARERMHDLRS